MPLTPQTLKANFFNVLKTDSAGADVRTALESGASGVITTKDLKKSLPPGRFVVVRYGPIVGARYQVQRLFVAWWLYDDVSYGHSRLNPLAQLIKLAYPTDAIPYCRVELTDIGDEIPADKALGDRPALPMRYTVANR